MCSPTPLLPFLQALKAADAVFGSTENAKGFRVINGCGVIQGDGIDIGMLQKISQAVLDAKYSPENVAYGMGGALLHRVCRARLTVANAACNRSKAAICLPVVQ